MQQERRVGDAQVKVGGLEHPGLLPASLLAPERPELDGRREPEERTPRDWVVDVLAIVLSTLVGGLLFVVDALERGGGRIDWAPVVALDVAGGVLAVVLLWWRRRAPVAIAIALLPVASFSVASAVACMVVAFTVAVHRPFRQALAVALLQVGAGLAFWLIRDEPGDFVVTFAFSAVLGLAIVAWGMFVRARRQLVHSLRERAERAERLRDLEVEQARHAERLRIAREMHDVLAHRVSLVALHAGGLEVRPDLPPEQVRASAQLISATSRQALEELRDVIGVLRGSGDVEAPTAPQPTVRDVHRLVAESRQAGERVTLVDRLAEDAVVPGNIGRAAYRIVQEALTNVHKHASGTSTTVTIEGAPGGTLHVEVRNRMPVGRAHGSSLPGAGAGLVGLAERVSLAGGTLQHGTTADGFYAVSARLRWET